MLFDDVNSGEVNVGTWKRMSSAHVDFYAATAHGIRGKMSQNVLAVVLLMESRSGGHV
jgi:hypothetical protein